MGDLGRAFSLYPHSRDTQMFTDALKGLLPYSQTVLGIKDAWINKCCICP